MYCTYTNISYLTILKSKIKTVWHSFQHNRTCRSLVRLESTEVIICKRMFCEAVLQKKFI